MYTTNQTSFKIKNVCSKQLSDRSDDTNSDKIVLKKKKQKKIINIGFIFSLLITSIKMLILL